ncbi:MAG TPA: nuclease-related domain-containing protein [Parasulfuritortus sp.]
MILKQSDDKSAQIKTLESLAAHPRLPASKKPLVEKELTILRSGIKGEREAAYDIDFYSGASKNRVVIHDLRLEHNGRVAQIDHLVINRMLETFIVETKHFAQGISISESGEFTSWYGSKGQGIPSPLEQNKRHIDVLRDLFKQLDMPSRLGFTLQPDFISIVLVSKNARITRPKKFDTSGVIKSDQFESWIQKHIDGLSPLQLAKLVSEETLIDIGRQLILRHKPLKPDYLGKFGIEARTLVAPVAMPMAVREPEPASCSSVVAGTSGDSPEAEEKKNKLVCVSCGAKVSYAVAKFCWNSKKRFGGDVFCMECQKKVKPKGA